MSEFHAALRLLFRSPGSTLLIVGLLALGVGTSTVVFDVFDAVMLRPLPLQNPEHLVRMVQHMPRMGTISALPIDYIDALQARSTSFSAVFGETGRYLHFPMTAPGQPEHVTVHGVTPRYFDGFGVRALYGRVLTPEDARSSSGAAPAVLSYDFWQRRFGNDRGVVTGRIIIINKRHFSVVGVMPRTFKGTMVDTGPDIRIPFSAYRQMVSFGTDVMSFEVVGRLKPGTPLAAAEAEAKTIWHSTMADYYRNVQKLPPEVAAEQLSRGMALESLERGVSMLRDRFGAVLNVVMACVGMLALIVCINVTGVLLARAVARQQETAIRIALGAAPGQLARQVLAESLWLVLLGCTVGYVAGRALMPAVIGLLPPIRDLSGAMVPILIDEGLSGRALLFLLALGFAMTVIAAVTPVLANKSLDLSNALRATRSSSGLAGRRMLITLQIAVCTFFLAGSALFLRTFQNLQRVDPGFDHAHIATFTGDVSNAPQPTDLISELTRRVGELPGVTSVAVSSRGLMRGRGLGASVALAGQRITRTDFLNVSFNRVSLNYFQTMGQRILAGRDFAAPDLPFPEKPSGIIPAIVNQTFAKRYFGARDGLGERFGVGIEGIARAQYEVIGIVSDAKYRSLREPVPPTFYTAENKFDSFVLNLRTQGDPAQVLVPVRRTMAALAPDLPFLEVHTMADEVAASIAAERVMATMAMLFGGITAVLIGAGLYGLFAYIVTQRRREFGIRIAMGARPSDILSLILSQSAAMTGAGIVLGLAGALASGSLVRSLVFGVSPSDPVSLIIAVLFVAAVSVSATALPALWAVRTRAAELLRYEA
jgi:predicted permease